MGRKYIDLTGEIINGIKVKEMVNEKGGTGKHKRWKCICPECGNEFITGSQHLRDKNKPISMCYLCGIRQYKDLVGQKFGRLTVLERDYNTQNSRVVYLCQCECGSIVSVQSNHLSSGEILSCGCLLSSGEEVINKYLIDNNIKYIKQKTFPECIDIKYLRFDFYIPEKNLVIEYQGIQHYEPTEYFGGEEELNNRKRRDQIKRDYCKMNGINYAEILYNEDIEQRLNEILSK